MSETKPTWKPDVCLYHANCADGFGAALAVWLKWGDAVHFEAVNYGLPFDEQLIAGKDVLIVDFSFKKDAMQRLAGIMSSVIVLDHHKTAEAELADIARFSGDCDNASGGFEFLKKDTGQNAIAWFDMEKSGARLAWEFCFPSKPVPHMLQMIEDRDLWRFALPDTKPFSLYLRSFPMDFEVWTVILRDVEWDIQKIIDMAKAVQRFHDKQVEDIADTMVFKDIGVHKGVAVAYAPYGFISDVCHLLLDRFPEAPFAACIVDAYGGRTYSLRSTDDRADVSEVAKAFGGGGHRNAAGFNVPV